MDVHRLALRLSIVCAAVVGFGSAWLVDARATAQPAVRTAAPPVVRVVGAGPLLWGPVAARSAPEPTAPVVRELSEFRPDFHPRWVLAVDARRGSDRAPRWYQILLPGRPNGQRGWIPASALDPRPVDRWLVVYRGSRRYDFVIGGRVVRSGKVAVGAQGMETPTGLFYVQSKFVPKKYPILGAFAFETSGYSRLSDWPGGGVVGVHGTPWPWLLGQAVSHGCVRMKNEDVLWLRSRMPLGTPVKIVPG